MERQPQPGDLVIYHDSKGVGHSALVTCTWSSKAHPLINLVYVSGDENRQDSYGRQLERSTSTMHKSQSNVHGNYWRFIDEEPNAYTPPASV